MPKLICVEINRNFVPKFTRAEVRLPVRFELIVSRKMRKFRVESKSHFNELRSDLENPSWIQSCLCFNNDFLK